MNQMISNYKISDLAPNLEFFIGIYYISQKTAYGIYSFTPRLDNLMARFDKFNICEH